MLSFFSWLWSWLLGDVDLLLCHLWRWHQRKDKVRFLISFSILISQVSAKERTRSIKISIQCSIFSSILNYIFSIKGSFEIDSIFNTLLLHFYGIIFITGQRLPTLWMMAQNVLLQEVSSPWLNKPLAKTISVPRVKRIETKNTFPHQFPCVVFIEKLLMPF